MSNKNFILIPLDELTSPEDGDMVYKDRYWQVTENNEVLFFRSFNAPQCNKNKTVMERIAQKYNRKVVFIPIAFVPIDWSEFETY